MAYTAITSVAEAVPEGLIVATVLTIPVGATIAFNRTRRYDPDR